MCRNRSKYKKRFILDKKRQRTYKKKHKIKISVTDGKLTKSQKRLTIQLEKLIGSKIRKHEVDNSKTNEGQKGSRSRLHRNPIFKTIKRWRKRLNHKDFQNNLKLGEMPKKWLQSELIALAKKREQKLWRISNVQPDESRIGTVLKVIGRRICRTCNTMHKWISITKSGTCYFKYKSYSKDVETLTVTYTCV